MESFKILLLAACVASLVGCGGGSSSTSSTKPITASEAIVTSSVASSAASSTAPVVNKLGILSFLIPQAEADTLPVGSITTVTISGQGINQTLFMQQNQISGAFSDLVVGDYSLVTEIKSGDIVVASGTATARIQPGANSVSLPMRYNLATLSVTPVITSDYSFFNGVYEGTARGNKCSPNNFINSFGTASVKTTISINGKNATIKLELFDVPTYILTGTIDDSTGVLNIAGTYQGSDFTTGTWTINKLIVPATGAFYSSIKLSGKCPIVLDVFGTTGYAE
jgi:hypothetical protein